jgi:cytochrome b561
MEKNKPPTGYSRTSILAHWVAAILVVTLFLTHEGAVDGDRNSTAYAIHIGGGAIVGLFLLWRVWRRIARGMTAKPDQHYIFNIASQIVIWGFLAAIVVVVVSGYLLPWSLGRPLDIFGLINIPSPMGPSPGLREFLEDAHEISGVVFVPLLILHVLGTAKHAFIDKDGVAIRMLKSVSGGR